MDSAIQSLPVSVHPVIMLSNNGSDSNDGRMQQVWRLLSQNVDYCLADFTSTISARLDHLHAVWALAISTSVQSHVRVSSARVQDQQWLYLALQRIEQRTYGARR